MPRQQPLDPERVIDVAAEVADRKGLEALSLAAVAAELGVRTPSLYNHVGGLDDLRRRLTVRALRSLGDVMRDAAVGRARDDAVVAIAAAYRSFAHRHPGLYAATVPHAQVDDPQIAEAGERAVRTVLAVLEGYGMDPDEAVHAARALRSTVHGFVSLELSDGFGIPVAIDASFEWTIEALVSWLRAHAGTGTPTGA
jgi:AcrR family transcriptional regulator